ncbi:hypothetical protein B0T19DRAFT_460013 [Cercophora scortea]|uniref:JmjC domain-containing protein n=1 Tax=Cercophora scortea TaxID=314031 RepID=A0AAE0IKW9_9PEZI|nr:hypothetical protein B0T19DRAFT_460013 [Cercophora scortea]
MEVTKPHGIELERVDETISKIEGLLRRLKRARAAMTNRPRRVLERPNRVIPAIPRSRTDTVDLHGSGSIFDVDDLYAYPEPASDAGELRDALNLGIIDEARTDAALATDATPATRAPTTDTTDIPTISTHMPATDTLNGRHHTIPTIKHGFEGSASIGLVALGAGQIGAFKVVLPTTLQQALPPREEAKAKPCWGFQTAALPNKTYKIGMLPKRQAFRRSLPSEVLSIGDAVKRHESQLGSQDGMDGVYYRVDVPAETAQQRAAAGLPERSLIWPLKGNMLSRTKYSIPGLHTPFVYESGPKFGALFGDHEEHYRLFSISHLHTGQKLWKVVPPSAADAFAKKLKETDPEIIWDCEQCLRHAAMLVPPSILTEWGIPFTILDQRAPELVIVFPRAARDLMDTHARTHGLDPMPLSWRG